LDGFLGIPQGTAPSSGAAIPKDRTLRFELKGPAPDLIRVELIGGDGNPAWSLVLPGSARSATIPDLSQPSKLPDIAAGSITWTVTAAKVDGLGAYVFNQFQYSDLSPRRLSHSAANAFVMRR
jgi:hypothetical protein